MSWNNKIEILLPVILITSEGKLLSLFDIQRAVHRDLFL